MHFLRYDFLTGFVRMTSSLTIIAITPLLLQIWYQLSVPIAGLPILFMFIMPVITLHYGLYLIFEKKLKFKQTHIISNICYKCIVMICGFLLWSEANVITLYNFISFCQLYLLYDNIVLYTNPTEWFSNSGNQNKLYSDTHTFEKIIHNITISALINNINGDDVFMITLVLLAINTIPYDCIHYIITSKDSEFCPSPNSIIMYSIYTIPIDLLIIYILYPDTISLIFTVHNLIMGLHWEYRMYNFLKKEFRVRITYVIDMVPGVDYQTIINELKIQCPYFDIMPTTCSSKPKKITLKCFIKDHVDIPDELLDNYNLLLNIVPRTFQLLHKKEN